MATLVLTVIGDDRAGLVNALAEVVSAHGGNWGRSQMAELGGKFAGIVLVDVPDDRSDDLSAALKPLLGLLDVTIHRGTDEVAPPPQPGNQVQLDMVGNDHPGIVRDVSAVLARHGISIDRLVTETRDAPMAGGRLFEAHVTATLAVGHDLSALQRELEHLATEIFVDIAVAAG